jgi:transcriptional regulator with PAS, ATPase and Fis domain
VTVIATTNRDLLAAVEAGEFREDLFFRLSTFHLEIPPLRERREDIPPLADHFVKLFAAKYAKKNLSGLAEEVEKDLLAYDWPGNVRELRNFLERSVVLENVESMRPKRPLKEQRKSSYLVLPETGLSLDEVEKDLVRQAMEMADNNQTKAAKLLGITYDTLRYQVKKYNIV